MKISIIAGRIYSALKYLIHWFLRTNRYRLTVSCVKYIDSDKCLLPDEDKILIKKFLSLHSVCQINYSFIHKYIYRRIKVFTDKKIGLHYICHNGRKLYFKRGMSKKEIKRLYNSLCIEQDDSSPHSYAFLKRMCGKSDIAIDVGAAEGIWGLSIVEDVRVLYLFECEEGWIEALNETFSPWKEKVHIVNKFVSDRTDDTHVTLDDYFLSRKIYPTYVKADIEGCERDLVKGAELLLSKGYIHDMLLCTYHNGEDLEILSVMMKKHAFEIKESRGYMTTIYSERNYCAEASKIFRKGIIHAYKPK
jgi:hypothetical protein